MMRGSKLFIKPLAERRKVKQEGGVFTGKWSLIGWYQSKFLIGWHHSKIVSDIWLTGWNAVVIMDDLNMQEIYRRILELGGKDNCCHCTAFWLVNTLNHSSWSGGKVEKWTARHLSDLTQDSLKKITHVISHPNMLTNEDFQRFLQNNDQTARVPTLAYIYIGDCLTNACFPSPDNYDIRQRCMIDLLVKNPEVKQYLQVKSILIGRWYGFDWSISLGQSPPTCL